jgi:uncharacterized membrane protein
MYRSWSHEQTAFLTVARQQSSSRMMTPGWESVLFWWLAFAGSHLILSSGGLRGALVARMGERGFAGFYSLVALATFVPIVWTYWPARHTGPLLWNLRTVPGATALVIALGAIGFALMAAAFVQPSATSFDPRAVPRAHGVTRLTRHPLFMGLALWGLGHALVNGFLSDVVFFAGFPLFALIGGAHQDARKQTEQRARLDQFYGETSMLPFVAVASGRNRLVPGELPWRALGIGTAVAIVLYLLHPLLFR